MLLMARSAFIRSSGQVRRRQSAIGRRSRFVTTRRKTHNNARLEPIDSQWTWPAATEAGNFSHLDLRLRFLVFRREALRDAAAVFSTAKSSIFAPALSFSRSQRG
jgi:hypothetical protein